MTGRNINIYFQEETYNKLRQTVKTRQVSRFVNQAVEEKLCQEEQELLLCKQKERKELRQKLIEEYKESVKNRSPEEKLALKAMEEASLEDIFTILNKKENEQSK